MIIKKGRMKLSVDTKLLQSEKYCSQTKHLKQANNKLKVIYIKFVRNFIYKAVQN